tara:strand:+ start:1752 stop:2015 length:264 start_codon:yes stop_codon:yes gene_type:complete
MRPLVVNEKSKATYQSYKNKEIEWYMCDLSKLIKLLKDIDLIVDAELYDYSNCKNDIGNVDSFNDGILAGRYEIANQLWEIINKKGE